MAETNVAKIPAKTGKAPGKLNIKQAFASLWQFLKEAKNETIHKCSWPTWVELKQFTIVVIFALVVVALWMGGINFLMRELTNALLGGRP
jgi:preprotein translocase SecE subunit